MVEKERKRREAAKARMQKKRQRTPTSDPPTSSDLTSPLPPPSEPPKKRRKYLRLKSQTPEETRALYQSERKEHMRMTRKRSVLQKDVKNMEIESWIQAFEARKARIQKRTKPGKDTDEAVSELCKQTIKACKKFHKCDYVTLGKSKDSSIDWRFGTLKKKKHTDARQQYEECVEACIRWQNQHRFIFDGKQLYTDIENVGDGYVKVRILKFDVRTGKAVAPIKIKRTDLINFLHFPKSTPPSPNMLLWS